MATEKNPSIYYDRGTIGSSDELDEYGVWVKSEPQDLSSASKESSDLPDPSIMSLDDLPDLDEGLDISFEDDTDSFDLPDIEDFSLELSDEDLQSVEDDENSVIEEADLSFPDMDSFDDAEISSAETSNDDTIIEDSAFSLPDDDFDLNIDFDDIHVPDDDDLTIHSDNIDIEVAAEADPLDEEIGEELTLAENIDADDFSEISIDDFLGDSSALSDTDDDSEELEAFPDIDSIISLDEEESLDEDEPITIDDIDEATRSSINFDDVAAFSDDLTLQDDSSDMNEDLFSDEDEPITIDDIDEANRSSINFDDIADESTIEKTISAESKNETVSSDLLLKIAEELSSIRKELSSLKSELSSIKNEEPDETCECETPDEDVSGFFNQEEDDKISLTGDELDNILNTADFTEEAGQDAKIIIEEDILPDEILPSEDLQPEVIEEKFFDDLIIEEEATLPEAISTEIEDIVETQDEIIDFGESDVSLDFDISAKDETEIEAEILESEISDLAVDFDLPEEESETEILQDEIDLTVLDDEELEPVIEEIAVEESAEQLDEDSVEESIDDIAAFDESDISINFDIPSEEDISDDLVFEEDADIDLPDLTSQDEIDLVVSDDEESVIEEIAEIEDSVEESVEQSIDDFSDIDIISSDDDGVLNAEISFESLDEHLEEKDTEELKRLREEGVKPLTPAPEDISYLQEDDAEHLDLSDAVIDEPDFSDIVENPVTEPVLTDLGIELDLEEEDLSSEDFENAESESEQDDELELSLPIFEDEEIDFDNLDSTQVEEENLEHLIPEGFVVDSDDSDLSLNDIDFEDDDEEIIHTDEEQVSETTAIEEDFSALSNENDASSIETMSFSHLDETLKDKSDLPALNNVAIPQNLKQELKTVLSYMDKLLESLPDDKIEEFARSEYFDTYKKLFEELGLV
jgi:hypothetical protein